MARLSGLVDRLLRGNRHKLTLAFVGTLAVVGSLPYHGLYDQWGYVLPVVGLVALALVVSAITATVLRLPWWASAVAFVVLGALYLGEVIYFGRTAAGLPKPGMFTALWHGLTGSWNTLLGVGLPADAVGDAVVLPIALAGIAAFVAAELALRRPWRVPPVLPGVATYGVALAFAGRARRASPIDAAVLALLVLLTIHRRANPPARRTDDGRSALARLTPGPAPLLMLGLLAVGGAGGWFLPVLDGATPFGLRDHYRKPLDVREAVTPLNSLTSRAKSDVEGPLFTVTLGGPGAGLVDRIPFAVLDTYDGAAWGTDARFDLAGRRLPATPLGPEPTGPTVRQTYTLKAWWSTFVPAVARPVALPDGARYLATDTEEGMLMSTPDAPADLTYTVESRLPTAAPTTDRVVPKATGALARYGVEPEGVREGFQKWLAGVVDPVKTQGSAQQLDAVAAALRAEPFGTSPDALAGHSLGRLEQLVAGTAENSSSAATAVGGTEQYASAFALAARMLGAPARIAVGYVIGQASPGAEVAVRASQIEAWPEVYVQDVGWTRYDVVPQRPVQVDPGTITPTPTAHTTVKNAGDVIQDAKCPQPTDCVQAQIVAASRSGLPVWTWLLVIPVLTVVAIVASLIGRSVLRMRRRGSDDPSRRIVGAWREVADWLNGCGLVRHPRSLTPMDVSAALAERSPELAGHLETLTPLVDVALYSPEPPSADDAAAAWAAERAVRREAARLVPVPSRLRARVDPRPLIRRQPGQVEVHREPELV